MNRINLIFSRLLQLGLFFIVIIVTSCSVSFEKRKYTGGYYIDIQTRNVEKQKRYIHESNIEFIHASDEMTASINDLKPQKITHVIATSIRQHEPCDWIYFEDGTQAEVKILDINEKEVAYRKCNDPSSPVIILNKKYITKIEFSSGERYEAGGGKKQEQTILQEEVQTTQQETNPSKKPNQSSAKEGIINMLALFFAIVGLIMLILAFVNVWYWLFGAAIFSALGASLGWFGITRSLKGLGIVALIIGTVCSVLSSILFGFI